ncbi:MAG: phosphotransferase [Planctomycetes bacterium]|nr:phosphotransferase [Planctomycetota bacterium]
MAPILNIEDHPRLEAYLKSTGRVGIDEPLSFQDLAGGVSNRTVLVRRPTGEAWVVKQALPKLRVPVDWFSSPERVHREALGLRWLARMAPPGALPPFVFEDHEFHLLVMEAVPQPHENWKSVLLQGRIDSGHVEQFARLIGTIHRMLPHSREEIACAFDDRTFFESLRLEPYYHFTASRLPEASHFLRCLAADTLTCRWTLVHGDYSPKNILLHRGRLILLDHEVIHFGDGGFDLGFSLTHFLSKAHHLAEQRQHFAEAARRYWTTYRLTLGNVAAPDDLERRAVRHTLGCLLARVAGRSTLEYLGEHERTRQREVVLGLLPSPPETVDDLLYRFLERL